MVEKCPNSGEFGYEDGEFGGVNGEFGYEDASLRCAFPSGACFPSAHLPIIRVFAPTKLKEVEAFLVQNAERVKERDCGIRSLPVHQRIC